MPSLILVLCHMHWAHKDMLGYTDSTKVKLGANHVTEQYLQKNVLMCMCVHLCFLVNEFFYIIQHQYEFVTVVSYSGKSYNFI
jgi:hypothetical protein